MRCFWSLFVSVLLPSLVVGSFRLVAHSVSLNPELETKHIVVNDLGETLLGSGVNLFLRFVTLDKTTSILLNQFNETGYFSDPGQFKFSANPPVDAITVFGLFSAGAHSGLTGKRFAQSNWYACINTSTLAIQVWWDSANKLNCTMISLWTLWGS